MKKSEEKTTSTEVRQNFKERAQDMWSTQGTKGYVVAFVAILAITISICEKLVYG